MVNLINNGTFNDLNGWELILPTGNTGKATVQNGYASISITSSPSGINRFLTSGLSLQPNTNYELKVSLGANPFKISIQPMLLNYNNLSEIVAQSSPIIPDPSGYFTIKLTTGSTVPVNTCLSFNLVTVGSYYFDEVILEKTISQNLIKNPGFDGLADWIFYTDGTAFLYNSIPASGETGVAYITVPNRGTNTQLHQSGIILTPNTDYKLSYFYKSGSTNAISVSIINHISPYNVIFSSTSRAVSGGKVYEHTFLTGTSVPLNARLLFVLFESYTYYIFDNITLEATSTPPPVCTPLICTLTLQ